VPCFSPARAGAANAQTAASFPVKPVKLVVPFAPGGPNDILARIVGQKWNEAWGHPAIIENRGGAGGTIGVEYGSKAPPDGYTIIMGGMSNLAVAVGMYSKLGYDPHELTPITNIAIVPYVLAVNPRVPAKNVAELIAVAKSKKSLLSYGSSGTGAVSHLACRALQVDERDRSRACPLQGYRAGNYRRHRRPDRHDVRGLCCHRAACQSRQAAHARGRGRQAVGDRA
jgi:tripartite-type tricarboxylate transporter receptor subunit TctC